MPHKIGENIRKLRINKGLSVHDLSRQTGLASNYLGALERGQTDSHKNPKIQTLMLIASALSASPLDLLKGSFGDDMAGPPPEMAHGDCDGYIKPDKAFRECFEIWSKLTPEQQKTVLHVAKSYLPHEPKPKSQKKNTF